MQDERAPELETLLQGAVLWSPQAKAGLVNANQKEWGYGKLLHGGSYPRGVQGEGSGRWVGLFITRVTREVISGTSIYFELCKLLFKACTCMRG